MVIYGLFDNKDSCLVLVAKYRFNSYGMHCVGKLELRSHNTSYYLIKVVTKTGLTVIRLILGGKITCYPLTKYLLLCWMNQIDNFSKGWDNVRKRVPFVLSLTLSLDIGFWWGSCYSIFSFMCLFCRSLFVHLYFFFWLLCCLSFDVWILITSLWYLQTLLTAAHNGVGRVWGCQRGNREL